VYGVCIFLIPLGLPPGIVHRPWQPFLPSQIEREINRSNFGLFSAKNCGHYEQRGNEFLHVFIADGARYARDLRPSWKPKKMFRTGHTPRFNNDQ